MLETLVPRLTPGAQWARRDDGSSVVFDPARGLYVEIARDQTELLALVDGNRTCSEIAAEHLVRHRFVPFQALGDLLATLRGKELLANPAPDLDRAGIPAPSRAFLVRSLAARLLWRARVPALGSLSVAVALAFAAFCVFVLGLAALRDPFWPFALHLDPVRPTGSAVWGLVSIGLGALAAVHARAFVRAGLGALWGWPPQALELRLRLILPAIEPEPGPVQLLGRERRMVLHLLSLASPWLVALAALVLFQQRGLAASFALGAAFAGFVDACPIAPTSLGQMLAAFAGRVDLRDHARSYLSRRFLSRLGSSFFEGEKTILVTATLAALWAMVGLEQLLKNAPRTVIGLWGAAGLSHGLEAAASWFGVVVVGAASVGGALFLANTMLAAFSSVVPQRMRARPARAAEVRAAPGSADERILLTRVPLFAALPPRVLDELAREVKRVGFGPGAVIVRQGDAGDRFYALLDGKVAVEHQHESGLTRVVAMLGPGDCFGEVALLKDVPRTATVRAAGKVEALALDRGAFQRLAKSLPEADLTRLIRAAAALHRSSVFGSLPSERISSLLPRLGHKDVEAGAAVVRKGEPGSLFYLVDEGELEVLDEAEERAVARLAPGDHFGEVALLRDVPRTATVRAAGPARVFTLTKADLFDVLGRDFSLSRSLEEQARVRVKGGR